MVTANKIQTNAVDPLASTTLLFTVVALLASFITAIYIPTNNRKHELSTCYWSLGRTPDATFTCTRETMICGDVAATIANTGVNLLKNRELCGELVSSKHILTFHAICG